MMGSDVPGITPGDWTLEDEEYPIVVLANGYPVATAHGDPGRKVTYSARMTEATANARLMAAAPELLAACRKFMAGRANYGGGFGEPFDHDEDFGDAMIAIEEAIAKATGQPDR